MKVAVITGSTRGIGLGLAREFLKRGCAVVVSGRTQAAVERAVSQLASAAPAGQVLGCPCDVTVYAQVQSLWDSAKARFGRVDLWINNAGLSHPRVSFWEQAPERLAPVIDTNLRGVMYGSHAAVRGMLRQGGGQIYNLEGFGSGGQMAEGMLIYGSTKRAATYFTESLAKDLRGAPVQVCHLSPGIVATDLLVDDYAGQPERFERAKKIFNILGDTVETVTPYLAEQMLANTRNGARIAWLTFPKIIFRFLTAGFNRRDLFRPPPAQI
jgi:NAD(P)-dependent dehydrogenase (short-subunit alcohol dehydrogenase family)